MSTYKFTPRAVASPDAPQTPLVRKSARSAGAWQPGKKTLYSWFAATCMHPQVTPHSDHRRGRFFCNPIFGIVKFWDGKMHPTRASHPAFLATCTDVDLEKNVKCVQWHKYTKRGGIRQLISCHTVGVTATSTMDSTAYSVPGIVQVAALCPFLTHAVCIAITQHTILALAWCHSLCRAEPPEPAAQKDGRKARQEELTENQCFLPFLAVAIHRAGGNAEGEVGDTGRAPGIPRIDIATH